MLKNSYVMGTNHFSLSLSFSISKMGVTALLAGHADQCPHLPKGSPPLTISSLPFLCRALDRATEVSTQAAKEQ